MFSAYEWFWSFMAAIAAVSLATMIFWPDVAVQIVGVKGPAKAVAAEAQASGHAPNAAAQDVAMSISEALALRQRTGVLQADIDKIKAEMSGTTDSDGAAAEPGEAGDHSSLDTTTPAMNEAAKALAITDEMAAREQAKSGSNGHFQPGPVSIVTSVPPAHVPDAPPEAARSRLGEVELPATPASPTITGSLPDETPASAGPEAQATPKALKKVAMVATVPDANVPAPTKKPAVAKQAKVEKVAKVETGAINSAPGKDAPISFGPAVVTKAPDSVGIFLGQGPSVDSLRLHWSVLADQQKEPLKGLEARYVTGSDNTGQVFKLVAGPIKSASDAKKVCKSLEDSGVSCSVGKFTGNAL